MEIRKKDFDHLREKKVKKTARRILQLGIHRGGGGKLEDNALLIFSLFSLLICIE